MLTRLKVKNFKNLIDVDVRFGPFTCIAGVNGSGKSNLFDAIQLLSALADNTLVDAALSIRTENLAKGDIRSLFFRHGDKYAGKVSLEAEMIVPKSGTDDLGQTAKASITFLRYRIDLSYAGESSILPGALEILHEELTHINLGEAAANLPFAEGKREWRESVIDGRRTSPFVSTVIVDGAAQIKLHQDGVKGRPRTFLAKQLPRTVLSTVNATESPTALMARREMQSWRLLHLEPSALREPDDFRTSPGLETNGAHLAATLYHLGTARLSERNGAGDSQWVYERVARRLTELIHDVFSVTVDADEKRSLFTVEVSDRNGTSYPARSLSDGTLRFLALVVLELDPNARGVLCFEEPENGVHPERIPAIIRLLQDIAVDISIAVSDDNSLRQVIINTHSPSVVMSVLDESLLVAETVEYVRDGNRIQGVAFRALTDTWRVSAGSEQIAKGKLLAYLNPRPAPEERDEYAIPKQRVKRVVDRPDLQMLLPFEAAQ